MRYDAQFQAPNTGNPSRSTLLESGDGGNIQPPINYHTPDTLPTAECTVCTPLKGSKASSGACAVCSLQVWGPLCGGFANGQLRFFELRA